MMEIAVNNSHNTPKVNITISPISADKGHGENIITSSYPLYSVGESSNLIIPEEEKKDEDSEKKQKDDCKSKEFIIENVTQWILSQIDENNDKKDPTTTLPYIVRLTPSMYFKLIEYFNLNEIDRESSSQFIVITLLPNKKPQLYPHYEGIEYAKLDPSTASLAKLKRINEIFKNYGSDYAKQFYSTNRKRRNRQTADLMTLSKLQQYNVEDVEELYADSQWWNVKREDLNKKAHNQEENLEFINSIRQSENKVVSPVRKSKGKRKEKHHSTSNLKGSEFINIKRRKKRTEQ